MHLYERVRGRHKGLVFAIAVFALIAGFLLFSLASATRRNDAREEQLIASALQRAVVTCYAVEGKYPPSLEYIYDNYGIRVDETRFAVFYDVIAANVMPGLRVARIGGGS
jgi:Kef-type K+ transport system membrane component KefB